MRLKHILLGTLAILLLGGLAGLLMKSQAPLFVAFYLLAFFIGVFLPVNFAISRVIRRGAPTGEARVVGSLRQVLVILGSGVLLGGSTCFGAAVSADPAFGSHPPVWALPLLLLCGIGFLIALGVTLVGFVKLIQRAVGIRDRP